MTKITTDGAMGWPVGNKSEEQQVTSGFRVVLRSPATEQHAVTNAPRLCQTQLTDCI